MNSENAYQFRHALLRDAAYQLHLPGQRARLHALALEVIPRLLGFPIPERITDDLGRPVPDPLPLDEQAAQLAGHARAARLASGANAKRLRALEHLLLERAAIFAASRQQLQAAVQIYRELMAFPGLAPALRLHYASRSATFQHFLGDTAGAHTLLLSSLETASAPSLAIQRAVLCIDLTALALDAGDLEEAGKRLEEALAALREAPHAATRRQVLVNQAILLRRLGKMEEAEAIYRELAGDGGDPANLQANAWQLGNYANLLNSTGRPAEAEAVHRRVLAAHRAAGQRRLEGVALANLGLALKQLGRRDEAAAAFREALAIHAEVGNRRSEGITLGNYANLLSEDGRAHEALEASRKALQLCREGGDRGHEAIALGNLARSHVETGQMDAAEKLFAEAVALSTPSHARGTAALYRVHRASCLVLLGRVAEARAEWEAASATAPGGAAGKELETARRRLQEACAATGTPQFGA